ncbi:hypothetical protein JW964_03910 [candidate division KSB1 bacterium]|nr:hypothetical protein [candidate division KSB1 bacterium]
MKKLTYLCLLLFLITSLSGLYAQGWQFHGKISNSLYAYEEANENQLKIYDYVRASLKNRNWGNLELNTSFRNLANSDDLLNEKFQFYTLNVKMQNLLGNHLDFQLGRQFLHPGTLLGGLDGLHATVKFNKNISLGLYGGVEAHFLRKAEIYDFKDSRVAGALFQWNQLAKTNLQLFALNKANEDETLWQLTGINVDNSLIPNTLLRVQAHYDLKNSRLHRLLGYARYTVGQKLFVDVTLKNQYPQVYANSFYTIFNIDAYQQYKFSATYKLFQNYFINGAYQILQLDDESANQILLSINNQNGSLGMIYESGYAGEQLGVMADYAVDLLSNLTLSASVDYSRYRVEEIYEYDNQLGNAVRLSYQFLPHWLLDVEYQWLTNRFKESDSRFLNHIHFSW